ncbi:MAG TPA: PepSY domain-containing protein [Hyphomicrobiaceae bacterium]|nr:PepSY domain-containing protein [Hyphomicrobiaceae bacterium]
MIPRMITTAVALALLAPAAGAGSYPPGCTTEPRTTWKAESTSAAKATGLDYVVSKTKISGTCHEVYATKGGQKFELFFNPVTNVLVHTTSK